MLGQPGDGLGRDKGPDQRPLPVVAEDLEDVLLPAVAGDVVDQAAVLAVDGKG